MAIQSIETLKNYFKAGKFPTQSAYEDLIDTIFKGAGNFLQVNVPTYYDASVGDIVQHVGNTNGSYTNGYVYKCTKGIKAGITILTFTRDGNSIPDNSSLYPDDGLYTTSAIKSVSASDFYDTSMYNSYSIQFMDANGNQINTYGIDRVLGGISFGNDSLYNTINLSDGSSAFKVIKTAISGSGIAPAPVEKYYRQTGSTGDSSGDMLEYWQEIPDSVSDTNDFEWERINVQPATNTGNVYEAVLSNYHGGSGEICLSDFNMTTPYDPIQISEVATILGLPTYKSRITDVYTDKGLSFTSILTLHNDGFFYGTHGTENNEVYVQWLPGGGEGASLVMTSNPDPRYWDVNGDPIPQFVVIPCGCSVTFTLTTGGWQPVSNFTAISAEDLTTKQNEWSNNN